jgi:hypothetical protein
MKTEPVYYSVKKPSRYRFLSILTFPRRPAYFSEQRGFIHNGFWEPINAGDVKSKNR